MADYSWVWHVNTADKYTEDEIVAMFQRIPNSREDLHDDLMDRLWPMPSSNRRRKNRLKYSYQPSNLSKPKAFRIDKNRIGYATSFPFQ